MSRIDVPDDAIRWAESRVAAGEAPSASAYLAELARRDRERTEHAAWLQAEIDKAVASGVDPRTVDEIFDDIEAEFFNR